ncbi:hypothetical protein EXIGLDRAFT_784678 [Exidia glandulosa HHB12029]|uniref:Uncharacterized protein n=1 Tax=Exidia glandulosa HHB12029 TaxID=1314781 RepID=A0A165YYL1_EXIGL|nr:hypothetical protein EXIGLDRAFT_784678 [Exidia glandulosa HHB12029]
MFLLVDPESKKGAFVKDHLNQPAAPTGTLLNTSHWAFLEQPDIVNAEIEKWLAVKVLKDMSQHCVRVDGTKAP